MLWKLPPRIKVYEALGALADGRVEIIDSHRAQVHSSARQKTYEVEWREEQNEISANDNGSYWQKYLSYPGLAVLMKLEKLPYEEKFAESLKNILWGNLNEQLRRDYNKVEEYILAEVAKKNINQEELCDYVTKVLEKLNSLQLVRPRFIKPPPKSNY